MENGCIYLAEFSFSGSTELVNEVLIQAPSEAKAKQFALEHAARLGLELFSITPATAQQIRLHHVTVAR